MKRKADASNNSNSSKVRRTTNIDVATSRAIQRTVKKEVAKTKDFSQAIGTMDYESFGISATGVAHEITSVLQRGDGTINQFNGQRVFPKSLKVRWKAMVATSTPSDSYNVIRFLIVQFFSDGNVTNPFAFLEANGYVGTTGAPFAPRLWQNKPYMKILYDHTDTLVNDSASGDYVHNYEAYIPGSKLRSVEFLSNSNVAHKGRIFFCAVSDSTAANHPHLLGAFEMVYVD